MALKRFSDAPKRTVAEQYAQDVPIYVKEFLVCKCNNPRSVNGLLIPLNTYWITYKRGPMRCRNCGLMHWTAAVYRMYIKCGECYTPYLPDQADYISYRRVKYKLCSKCDSAPKAPVGVKRRGFKIS